MSSDNTPPAARGQVDRIDFFDAMLLAGKAPALDKLLKLTPDEPLFWAAPLSLGIKLPAGARLISLDRRCTEERLAGGVPVIKFDGGGYSDI
jgi:hypothetical protein